MKCSPMLALTLAAFVLATTGCKDKNDDKAVGAFESATPVVESSSSGDPEEVVATVNGAEYLRKEMDKTVNALLTAQSIPAEQQAEARKFFEQRAVYSFIMKKILLDEAAKESIAITDEDRAAKLAQMEEALKRQDKTVEQYFSESPLGEAAARAEFEDGMLIDKLVTKKVLDNIKVEQAEIDKVIADAEAQNAELEKNKESQGDVKVAAKAKIDALKKQLDEGVDFAGLAKESSDCPSADKGGDLGEFGRGQMVKPFEDAAFSQEVGKVGDVVETQFGYHLIKVTAKSPATEASGDTPAKPETVTASHILVKVDQPQQPRPVPTAEQVQAQLKESQSREAVQAYIEGIKKAATIETIFKDLDI